MAQVETDIDIDFANRDVALQGLPHVPAMVRDKAGKPTRHLSGVYFQTVPKNPLSGLSAYTYKEASEHGYFKIDFLNNSFYREVKDLAHLDALLAREPMWELLDDKVTFDGLKLSHISNHYGVVQSMQPRSIDDLALVLALIRPGKIHLLGKTRAEIEAVIWKPEPTGFTFKRAHAIAYAALLVVQMNLAVERLMSADEPPDETPDEPDDDQLA